MKESLLVNTLGHAAGVLVFSIFLFLLIQDRAARRLRGGVKSMLAAALALVWNLASLLVLGMGAHTGSDTIAFSVLSLLPAVLFDLCLAGRQRPLVGVGYALSVVAIGLHAMELFRHDAMYHRWGLNLITAGFVALTCMAAATDLYHSKAWHDRNRRAATSRLVGTMSLFLLAISFVHFGDGHTQQVWSQELAFHHAAIPLALLVLLQDYRFVLLDAFLRFLANVLLAALFVSAGAAVWRLDPLRGTAAPFDQALLLTGACLLLIVFALLRTRVQAALTRLVFRRKDVEALLRNLKEVVRDEQLYMESAAAQLGEFVSAQASFSTGTGLIETGHDMDSRRPMLASEFSRLRGELEAQGVEVVIPLRLPSRGTRFVLLGRRAGGRRYLSEDLAALSRAASVIVEQVEQFRESEIRRLVAQAELRALQSQIHPHFLFNALNALYGIIPKEAKGARETVLNLADIFRYFLETRKMYLPLERELHIVKAYLEIERLRLGEKLRTEIDVAPEVLTTLIPVLSIQPLVENAVKHGIAPLPQGGLVRIEARRNATGSLEIRVWDTGSGFAKPGEGGIGLENVARRLELCYGPGTRLEIESGSGGTAVSFAVPAESVATLQTAGVGG